MPFMEKVVNQGWTCEIIDNHCFSEGDSDDGYCKMCRHPKPNPYLDRSVYEEEDKKRGKNGF